MPETIRYWNEETQSGARKLWYRTAMMNAVMPMPVGSVSDAQLSQERQDPSPRPDKETLRVKKCIPLSACPVAGVLDKPLQSANSNTAQWSSRTGPPVYIAWNRVHPL
jgi:hypothetical protein